MKQRTVFDQDYHTYFWYKTPYDLFNSYSLKLNYVKIGNEIKLKKHPEKKGSVAIHTEKIVPGFIHPEFNGFVSINPEKNGTMH